jgi:hypothetical protein
VITNVTQARSGGADYSVHSAMIGQGSRDLDAELVGEAMRGCVPTGMRSGRVSFAGEVGFADPVRSATHSASVGQAGKAGRS